MKIIVKEEIAPGIVIYNNVIPNSENLHDYIEKEMVLAGVRWEAAAVKESSDPIVNTQTRDTSIVGVECLNGIQSLLAEDPFKNFFINMNNIFFQNFDILEKDYMSAYAITSDWHETYSILKYGFGQKFTNHVDDHPSYHRRISTVYYLNDNYQGGEINFPRFNITLKPKANQMIVFPSTYVYNHSVSPVSEGERYAVVSWLR